MRFAAVLGVVGLAFILVSLGFINVIQANQSQDQTQRVASLESQVAALRDQVGSAASFNASGLPLMNQTNTIRQIRETWYLTPEAHQDRFNPSQIVVNQGDTIDLTFIDNDTVAHDFVIGPPYNIIVNATVPGLINDLTGQTFTTQAKNNSPGAVVTGTPGNVTATYSFVAKYAGIFEFVCTYHAAVGMIGYLTVLPDLAYTEKPAAGHEATTPGTSQVSIVQGAGVNTTDKGYAPDVITVVTGVNSTVTWVNNDSSPHTVTANDGSFNSGNMAPGESYSFTFTTPGTYDYHCVYHPWMIGTVIVKSP